MVGAAQVHRHPADADIDLEETTIASA